MQGEKGQNVHTVIHPCIEKCVLSHIKMNIKAVACTKNNACEAVLDCVCVD